LAKSALVSSDVFAQVAFRLLIEKLRGNKDGFVFPLFFLDLLQLDDFG